MTGTVSSFSGRTTSFSGRAGCGDGCSSGNSMMSSSSFDVVGVCLGRAMVLSSSIGCSLGVSGSSAGAISVEISVPSGSVSGWAPGASISTGTEMPSSTASLFF